MISDKSAIKETAISLAAHLGHFQVESAEVFIRLPREVGIRLACGRDQLYLFDLRLSGVIVTLDFQRELATGGGVDGKHAGERTH